MTENSEYCLVLSTSRDEPTAQKLARGLVAARLAACVNIVPGLTSVYAWQGQIESDQEYLLVVKTRFDRFQSVRDYLRANHPYELPEIIAIPLIAGLKEYLSWVDSSLQEPAVA